MKTLRRWRAAAALMLSLSLALPLPVQAAKPARSSAPEQTFDTLWTFFDQHYASFPEKGIDWNAAYARHRPQVTADTTDEELFALLRGMLAPLNDAHVSLTGPSGQRFTAARPSAALAEFGGKGTAFARMVDSTLQAQGFAPLKTAGPVSEGRPLFSHTTSSRYAYLRFTRCYARLLPGGLLLSTVPQDDLDAIFATFADKDALIIDVRFNSGGHRDIPFAVVARLIQQPLLAHYRQDKNGPGRNDFGPLVAATIQPHGRQRFAGRVIVLTNDRTMSAADEFALAMTQLPQATLVGGSSNGSFSDSYPRLAPKKLPNGWKLQLSNQRYFSPDKVNYEGTGVPVDIEVSNVYAHIDTVGDAVLLRALDVAQAPAQP